MASELSAPQQQALRDALLAAFPQWNDLDGMFHAVFGKPLNYCVAEGPLETVASQLIVWVRGERKLDQLLDGALEHNPGNPQLRAAVEGLRRQPPDTAAVAGAVALGELSESADLDRCVYVAAVVYDLVGVKARLRQHIDRASRRPEIVKMKGQTAVQLRSSGYHPRIMRVAVVDAFQELVGEASDLRVFAVVAPLAARPAWAQQRSQYLAGLLGERFKKRNHGITRVLALRDRLPDSIAAVNRAWAQHGDGPAAPAVHAESPAGDALCGLCDVLAGVVHRAHTGEMAIPRVVRGKIVHIYDHATKRNYRLSDTFP